MSLKLPDEQKSFVFRLSSVGVPVAEVERVGTGLWLVCCPLCGMLHDVTGQRDGVVIAPRCDLSLTHPWVYTAWLTLHPDAAQFQCVLLTFRRREMLPEEVMYAPAQ